MSKHHSRTAIVIPIYLSTPTDDDTISLRQAYKVLSRNHQIYFIAPWNLELVSYLQQIPTAKTIRLQPSHFASIYAYNKLLLSNYFYRFFSNYDYILIYQTDAYVFDDQLNEWASYGFDFIGAPWCKLDSDNKLVFQGVGNGGFSLRRIRSFLRVGSTFRTISPFRSISLTWKAISPTFLGKIKAIRQFLLRNNTFHLLNNPALNEDVYWGGIVPSLFPWFKIPAPETAGRFAFEKYPKEMMNYYNQLPFGCHAWRKYAPDFWLPILNHKHLTKKI